MSAVSRFVLGGMLWLWLLTFSLADLDRPIGDGDESFHAQTLLEMMQSGRYLDTTWQGVLALERPALPFWLAAPFAALIPGERGMRMSSALASFATLVVTFVAARRFFGRADAAFVAALVLAGAPSFHVYSRTLMSDPPYVFALTLALVGVAQAQTQARGLRLAGFGLGFAAACKSLVVAVPALALAPFIVRAARRAPRRELGLSIAIALALALPFFVLGFARHGLRFWQDHVLFNLVARATTGIGLGLPSSPAAYLRWIPHADGPAITALLVLGTLGASIVGALRRELPLLVIGCYGSALFLLMSLVNMRLPHYALPIYPSAALGVAGCYRALAERTPLLNKKYSELCAPALAMIVLLVSRAYPGGNEFLLQRAAGRELGTIARRALAPGQPVFAYEWYGPSLGFYARHRCILLTSHKERFAAVDVMDVLHRARAIALVPPPPLSAGSELVIAGEARELSRAPWLDIGDVLGNSPPYFLVRAKIRAALTPDGSAPP